MLDAIGYWKLTIAAMKASKEAELSGRQRSIERARAVLDDPCDARRLGGGTRDSSQTGSPRANCKERTGSDRSARSRTW
jgi:hypothetical protein